MSRRSKPRYQQVKDLIIDQISRGRLRPRDRVPSENELVEATGVSRMTANRALRELTNEGYVERVAGSGTFVRDPKASSDLLEVRNIADEVTHRGHRHSSRVVRQAGEPATVATARALDIEPGDPVNRVVLVHYEDGTPIQVEDRTVVPDFAPKFLEQDFSATTPSAYLSEISPLQEAEHTVRAEMPDAAVRAELGMAADEPCLVVVRRTWGRGRPVTYSRLHHPGGRFELTGHYTPPGRKSARGLRPINATAG